jgi:CheY-like chemotaxis protein
MTTMIESADKPAAVLLSPDLFFASKITGTASELGFHVHWEREITKGMARVGASHCHCLILDLSMPGLNVADVVRSLPATERPAVIAFGSHVLAEKLKAAREAGCDEVMPRSVLSETLPQILKRHLGSSDH